MPDEEANIKNGVLVRLCVIDDVDGDEPLRIEIDGSDPVCVCVVEGKVYVTSDTCTHAKASLGNEGELDGFVLTCSWHEGQFDIRTGEVIGGPCTVPIKTYKVTIKDGDVFIAV
jgi:nitrite reductase/ring-hydroxylating ferredoxin subunit